MHQQWANGVVVGFVLLSLSGEVWADRPVTHHPLRGVQSGLCASLAEAQNIADKDPVIWQRLYAACLVELQQRQAEQYSSSPYQYQYVVPYWVLPAY